MAFEYKFLIIVGHFLTGGLLASWYISSDYEENGSSKRSINEWAQLIVTSLLIFAMGYLGVIMLIPILLGALFVELIKFAIREILKIAKKFKHNLAKIKWPSLFEVGFYSFFFLLFGGLITECTAPREGAHCKDGWYSDATGQGACSHHGGVSSWDKDYWWEDDDE